MFYCDKLSFGIIPPNRFLNVKTMNIVSSYAENEYQFGIHKFYLFNNVC